MLPVGKAGVVVQDDVLTFRSAGQGGGVGGIDEVARLQGAGARAGFLNLRGKGVAVKLGANQHAGVGIAVSVASLVKVAEKSQSLALSRQLVGGMRIIRLLRSGRLRGLARRRTLLRVERR